MDYFEELNDQIQRQYELEDAMERLGCETFEEYIDKLADLKADYQESLLDDIGD